MDLAGKKAIVLGGSSGIGLATVEALAARGTTVVAGGRSPERIQSAAVELGDAARFETIDVLDRAGLAALFEREAPFRSGETIFKATSRFKERCSAR